MSIAPSPADHEPGAGGLVEMEHDLTRLLLEYDEFEIAWPKGRHVLIRAKAKRQAADALVRIGDLQNAIATTPEYRAIRGNDPNDASHRYLQARNLNKRFRNVSCYVGVR